jgi:hypothetical protein
MCIIYSQNPSATEKETDNFEYIFKILRIKMYYTHHE